MPIRFPWEDPAEAPVPANQPDPALPPVPIPPRRRGRRPAAPPRAVSAPAWLYHHLIVSGPAQDVADFAVAARGAGVIPWRLDYDRIEEDVFNLAVRQPAEARRLTVEGCHILARQFRERVEAHQARAAALVGISRNCPLDLHALLPVPPGVLRLGPAHPDALAWLRQHWGTTDRLRQVETLPAPKAPRLPLDHAAAGYGFFTAGETPEAAVAQLRTRWPALRCDLRPRPD